MVALAARFINKSILSAFRERETAARRGAMTTALPPLTFQSLRADDEGEERAPVETDVSWQRKLQRHGVARVNPSGVKRRKQADAALPQSMFQCFFLFFLVAATVVTLTLTLRSSSDSKESGSGV